MSKSKRPELENKGKMLRLLLGKLGKRRGISTANGKKKMNSISKTISDSIAAIAKGGGETESSSLEILGKPP